MADIEQTADLIIKLNAKAIVEAYRAGKQAGQDERDRLQEALSELRRRARIATCSYFADDPEERVIACMEELDDELQDAGGE